MNIDKLKKVMADSLPEKVLKDIDGRTVTKAPWQGSRRPFKGKGFKKKSYAHYCDEDDDEEDVDAVDDEWHDFDDEEEEWEDPNEEEDPDQVAYVDEEGWFYADEETINAVDESIAFDDGEYANQVITYTEARNALAKARIARGFYPVVVPADDGRQPRFNRAKKGEGKRQGKGETKKGQSATSSSTNGPGTSSGPGGKNEGGKGKGQGRPSPICYRCGKKGHLSNNCTNPPLAKRRPPGGTDSASVIFDMTPWANDFADWRAQQTEPHDCETEKVNSLEETKGCAILDSGATVMCSSTLAAEEIQLQRLRQNEPGQPKVQESDRCFRFADGRTDAAQNMVKQPITAGLLTGKSISMHLIDKQGNDTSPLFSIDDQRRHRMVVDYEENKIMFKDRPSE